MLTEADPRYYRYYQYFGEHLIPIFCTVYMIMVHDMWPRYRDIWISVGALALMAVPAIFLNDAFPGSDYMFLKLETPLLPENQLIRAAVFAVAVPAVFHLMWLIWNLMLKIEKKRSITSPDPG